MKTVTGAVTAYRARGWHTVPVHRPDDTLACSCGRANCPNVGKHPVAKHWPGGSADPADFAGRNVGVKVGPDSRHLADVDCDCAEAIALGPLLLPATDAAFGRGGQLTHALFTVADGAAEYAKLHDPVLTGDDAVIVELRWPSWDEVEQRYTALQSVLPPSLHHTGDTITWGRDGDPAAVPGADLGAAVRHIGAATLLARYARPAERHQLVLLAANLLVRAGWADDAKIVRFIAAVFVARSDRDKAAKVTGGEGLGAVKDARKRLKAGKPMTGLPALRDLLDPALDDRTAAKVVGAVAAWLGVPGTDGPRPTLGGRGPDPGPAAPPRYTPLPPWRPFPTDHLPDPVRDFVATVSAAMRCDPTYAALPALAVCAGMIGATRQVRLKKSWCEPAVTWAVVVGDSGTLKTPPYKRAVAPVLALQAAHFKRHKAELEQYRADLREYERVKRRCKDDDPGDPPAVPVCTRVYSRDTTVEALAGLLADNRDRFLVGRDEVSGWLGSFNQYKAKGGSDLANWLELHGLGTLCVDRKTGEPRTVFVHGVGVSLCGGIQPGVLRTALSPQHFSAGVPARLLFAYPPRRPKEWTEDDVDEAAEARYHALVAALAALEPRTDADGEPYPATLDLDADAKREWVAFYARFAHKQARTDGDLAAAFSKLEGYAARLALLHHVCRSVGGGGDGTGPVAVGSVRAGVALAEWFTYEAERVYQMLGEQAHEEDTRKLVDAVARLAAEHGGRVTARQLQRSNQRKFRSAEAADAALGSLVGLGLGRWEDAPLTDKGGHRPRCYVPCVTCDTCDTRPDDGGGDGDAGACDTRPEGPGPGPTDGGPAEPATGSETTSCDGATEDDAGRVSHVSHVTHGAGEQRERPPDEPPESGGCHTGPGPRVTREGEPRAVRPAPGTVVSDAAGLAALVGLLAEWTGPVGLDTETTGLDPARDRVRLLQLAAGGAVHLIDLFAFPDPPAALAPLFAALAEKEVVGHNLQFDLRMLAPLGFSPGRVFDTVLASRVLHAGARGADGGRLGHRLADVARRELGVDLDKAEQRSDWSGPLTAAQLAYAAADAAVLVPLARVLRNRLAAAGLAPTADLEMRALPGVAWAGPVTVDRPAWLALARAAEGRRRELADAMDRLAPDAACLPGAEARNWNRPADVRAAFAAVGVTLGGADDAALAALDHPLADLLRAYRGAAKLAGTYGRDWLAEHAPDGRVRCAWNQLGAESGRMSCSDPNLQQVPREFGYRRCIVAPPGRVLVKADYSQVELRIAARLAGERVMIDAYRAGGDLHRLTAARVLGKPEAAVTKDDRQVAKSLNFGLLYGMGWRGLRAYAQANYGVALSDPQARAYRDAFFRAYPGLAAWHRGVRRDVQARFDADPTGTHEVRTLGGRRRTLPVAKTRADGRAYPNVTEALNTPVQGTGADGLKAAVARLWDTRADCPGAVPVLFCHDEVVLEVPAGDADRAAAWLKRCMTEAVAPVLDPVPVEVDVTVGRTWGG